MNVVSLKRTKSGSWVRSITPYDSSDTALSKFYEGMANGVNDSNVVEISCLLLDDVGAVHNYAHWAETPGE